MTLLSVIAVASVCGVAVAVRGAGGSGSSGSCTAMSLVLYNSTGTVPFTFVNPCDKSLTVAGCTVAGLDALILKYFTSSSNKVTFLSASGTCFDSSGSGSYSVSLAPSNAPYFNLNLVPATGSPYILYQGQVTSYGTGATVPNGGPTCVVKRPAP